MEACVARLVIASSTEDCCIKERVKWKEPILLRTSEKILLSNDEE